MWPVLVLGILTAIFAWVWYNGKEEAREPEEEDGTGTRQEPGEQEAPAVEIQKKILDINQTKKEELPRAQERGVTAAQQAGVKEHPTALPKIDKVQADVKEHPTDLPKIEKVQADVKEHPTALPKNDKVQAGVKEHPTALPKNDKVQADVKEHPTALPKIDKVQADVKEHPTALPKNDKVQTDVKEHPTDLPSKEELQHNLKEHPTDAPNVEDQGNALEPPTCVPVNDDHLAEEHLQTLVQGNEMEAEASCKNHDVPPSDIHGEQVHPSLVREVQHPGADLLVEANGDVMAPALLLAEEPEAQKLLGVCVREKKPMTHTAGGCPLESKETSSQDLYLEMVHTSSDDANVADGLKQESIEKCSLIKSSIGLQGSEASRESLPDIPKLESSPVDGGHPMSYHEKDGACLSSSNNNDKIPCGGPPAAGIHGTDHQMINSSESNKIPCGGQSEASIHESDHQKTNGSNINEKIPCGGPLEASIHESDYQMINGSNTNEKVPCGGPSEATIHGSDHQKINDSINNEKIPCGGLLEASSHESDHQETSSSNTDEIPYAGSLEATIHESDHQTINSSNTSVQVAYGGPLETTIHEGDHQKTNGCIANNILYDGPLETTIHEGDHQKTNGCIADKILYGGPLETTTHDGDHQKIRKVATIQPMPQNVSFAFKVHYITHSDSQIIGITGDHERLGQWESYVPLTSDHGGYWSRSVTLPVDTNLAWKLVMVENGKIKRWEECGNRILKTAHEDIESRLYWGFP